jgi:WhiB family redox-sensing transcriptional regulator
MDESWRPRAACLGMDTELWYPPEDGGGRPYTRARKVCLGCEVRPDCLAYILSIESREGPRHGMWAAMSPDERMRAARAKARRLWRKGARERALV